MPMRSEPRVIEGQHAAGIRVLNVANNRCVQHGVDAVADRASMLDHLKFNSAMSQIFGVSSMPRTCPCTGVTSSSGSLIRRTSARAPARGRRGDAGHRTPPRRAARYGTARYGLDRRQPRQLRRRLGIERFTVDQHDSQMPADRRGGARCPVHSRLQQRRWSVT